MPDERKCPLCGASQVVPNTGGCTWHLVQCRLCGLPTDHWPKVADIKRERDAMLAKVEEIRTDFAESTFSHGKLVRNICDEILEAAKGEQDA